MSKTEVWDADQNVRYSYDDSYEQVYDEDERAVECPHCGEDLMWREGNYICPCCGDIMTRQEFFDYIGADIPGPECLDCDDSYPNCNFCIHGYK